MGPAIVLLFWMIAGGTLAGLIALPLVGLTALLTRKVTSGRKRAIWAAAILPFACLVWAGIVVITLAAVDTSFFDRDMGFGDTWFAPLTNGYRIIMIDVVDTADICKEDRDILCADPPLAGVKNLQVWGPYFAGETSGEESKFFLFDARNEQRTDFTTLPQLAEAMRAVGGKLNLEPVYMVYVHYRWFWSDEVGIVAILLPPVLGVLLGFLWVLRLRRRAAIV